MMANSVTSDATRRRRRGARTTALALLLALSASGCSRPVRQYACSTRSGEAASATRRWECNREIMHRVVDGGRFSLREYRGAASFFVRLTGIDAESLSTPVGPVPAKGLRHTVELWDAWHAAHGDSLVYDAASGEVRVRGDGSADGS